MKSYPSLESNGDSGTKAVEFGIDYSYFKYIDPVVAQ